MCILKSQRALNILISMFDSLVLFSRFFFADVTSQVYTN